MSEKTRFLALDGWRGVAAIMVTFQHVPVRDGILRWNFFNNTGEFVTFFFVLSGFVISHAFGRTNFNEPNQLLIFLLKRFGRLWPLLASMATIFFVLNLTKGSLFSWYGTASNSLATSAGLVGSTVAQLAFLQSIFDLPTGVEWNGPSWSICVEFWAYVTFALVNRFFINNRIFIKVIIAIFGLLLSGVLFNGGATQLGAHDFFWGLYCFFIGQILYQLYNRPFCAPWRTEFSKGFSTFMECGCILATFALVCLGREFTYCGPIVPFLFAGIIFVFAPEHGTISRLLTKNIPEMLGKYSYSIYMVQAIWFTSIVEILRILEKLTHRQYIVAKVLPDTKDSIGYSIHFASDWIMVIFAFALIILLVPLSHLTYHWIERPGQKFFNKLAASARATPPAVSAPAALL